MDRGMKKKMIFAAFAAFAITVSASAGTPDGPYKKAMALYESGMYERALSLFESMSLEQRDPLSEGYALLCDMKIRKLGYEEKMSQYFADFPETALWADIHYQHGLNLFDLGDYDGARTQFASFSTDEISADDMAEYLYKRAYSDFMLGSMMNSKIRLEKILSLPFNDYTSPTHYTLAYILYAEQDFVKAEPHFIEAAKDPRFEEQSSYYVLECRFMDKDYSYVTANGPQMYEKVPEERKKHLARIISESYLVQGDAERARDFFGESSLQNRSDYFYAGSVLYEVKDYMGAIDHYAKVTAIPDSLSQIAHYQTADSYLQVKNRVAAMQSFKSASELSFDPAIQEDAMFNYAKLAFDLNRDTKGFGDYIARYADKKRGDDIYSYMALAALVNRDYASAVKAYDMIDELTPDMRSNYMKANYLRAVQLVQNGSYSDAVNCLRAASFFTGKNDPFNQLARYWLSECYFRTEKYEQAEEILSDLRNLSALDGSIEGDSIVYNLAYCFFEDGAYADAAKWFDRYIEEGGSAYRKDAAVRRADCDFIRKNYTDAISGYESVIVGYPGLSDLYPRYQLGLAYGLAGKKSKKTDILSTTKSANPSTPLYAECLYELGRAYVDVKNPSEAAEAFMLLKDNAKDSTFIAKACIELGMLARNAKDYDKALTYYKQVVEQMPHSGYREDALLAIESIYQTKGEPEEYLEYIENNGKGTVKTAAEKELVYFNSAEQIYLSENYQKALVALDKYIDLYPEGSHLAIANLYAAECCKELGKKEKALDYYKASLAAPENAYRESALSGYATLCYGLERYADAYQGYASLKSEAKMDANVYIAMLGMMRSAYRSQTYELAIDAAQDVRKDNRSTQSEKLEADYVKAKSLLATSQRTEAFELLKKISASASTEEGAEASYLIIQDTYDRGDFDKVEDLVYAFAPNAGNQLYWLAKAYIVLGDAFVEKGNISQAKATYKSLKNGYEPYGDTDDVLDNVNMRLEKLNLLSK